MVVEMWHRCLRNSLHNLAKEHRDKLTRVKINWAIIRTSIVINRKTFFWLHVIMGET
jgi:hypothetical protein